MLTFEKFKNFEIEKNEKKIEIREVRSRAHLKDFLDLPGRVYSNSDPHYVRPLNLHMKMMMGSLATKEKHFFVAYSAGKPVARLGVKVHQHKNVSQLNFGFFECVEGFEEAGRLLFEKAQFLYPTLKLMGPFHFRMEDPYIGVLVEGFDMNPYFLMPYNPRYYDKYLLGFGLQKAMDLFTYQLDSKNADRMPVIDENAAKSDQAGISIRTLNMKNLDAEARAIAGIFNDALSKNWGYEEFLEEQVKEMVTLFKLFIDPRVVAIAEKGNRPIGCLLMLPDYNPLIKDSGGKITPSVVWKYFFHKKKINTLRGYALGVLREFHGFGVGSALVKHMFKAGPIAGYPTCEVSWVLANNGPMNELSKAMQGKHNKVYRVYEKPALKITVDPEINH